MRKIIVIVALLLLTIGCNSIIFIPVENYNKPNPFEYSPNEGVSPDDVKNKLGEPDKITENPPYMEYVYKINGWAVNYIDFDLGVWNFFSGFSNPVKMTTEVTYVFRNSKFICERITRHQDKQ